MKKLYSVMMMTLLVIILAIGQGCAVVNAGRSRVESTHRYEKVPVIRTTDGTITRGDTGMISVSSPNFEVLGYVTNEVVEINREGYEPWSRTPETANPDHPGSSSWGGVTTSRNGAVIIPNVEARIVVRDGHNGYRRWSPGRYPGHKHGGIATPWCYCPHQMGPAPGVPYGH